MAELDQIGLKSIEWTKKSKWTKIDRVRLKSTKWIEVTKMNRNKPI